MIMRDKRVKDLFGQELEIPDVVSDKMREAYKQIGADMEKADRTARKRHVGGYVARRYLKAASIMFCFLIAATTVSAAVGGGFEKISKFFKGDVKQIESSSSQPEVSSEKSSFKNLKVSVEQVAGTEELTYVILKVKRTDGKNFDKDKNYTFKSVGMIGEKDMVGGMAKDLKRLMVQYEVGNGSRSDITISGGDDSEFEIDSESRFTDTGVTIENKGTDEIYLVVTCGYERVQNGKSYYHKGEKCVLLLNDFCQEGKKETEMLMEGTSQAEFVLDYGECPKKVVEPDQKIKLPKDNSDTDYLPVGTLKRVTITPYYIQYEREMSEKEWEANVWDQIYVEMEDGTLVGYPTREEDRDAATDAGNHGGYGSGITDEKDGKTQMKNCLLVPELIDVDHVEAVWFGKTRIGVK